MEEKHIWEEPTESPLKTIKRGADRMREASTIQSYGDQSLVLFGHEIHGHFFKRLELINKTITDYMELKGLSISEMKEGLIHYDSIDVKKFYYKDDLIISIQNGFTVEGISYVVKYQINKSLTKG
jgi:hypothetical protein